MDGQRTNREWLQWLARVRLLMIVLILAVGVFWPQYANGQPSSKFFLPIIMAANEASAVGSLRTINTAAVTYSTTYQSAGYPTALSQLAPPTGGGAATSTASDLIDSVLAGGTKSGYGFNLKQVGSGTPSTGYSVVSAPVNPGTSGQRGFYTDQSGVIRGDSSGTADSTSSPLQ